ncbi:MAG: sugar transferase [Acidimicrobiia bacterium]
MRVVHLTTVDISLRYLLLPQLRAVVDAGGEAVGISAPGSDVPQIEAAGVRHIALTSSTRSMSLTDDLRAAIDLWRILRRERPDVLHTHNPKPGVYGRIVGRLAGVPIVVNTVHGLYATENDPLPKRLAVYGLEAVASRFSDAELVQNPEDLALMRRWRIASPRKLALLGNGVDLTRFDAARVDDDERASVRAEFGVARDQILVGVVARLVAEKGYPELFEAMTRLPERYVLVAIGPDNPEKADALPRDLVDRAQAAGVRFVGMRTDVDRCYRAMDLFVLPSHREGFPRAAMEAAAMGLPIVATDVRGCREVVEHGVNGFLLPVADPVALADAIDRIGSDPTRRATMGAESARIARERFDERRVVRTVLGTYAAIAWRKGLALERTPRRPRRLFARATKRALDAAGAALALVVLAPLIGLIALVVRVTMGAPVFYMQERPGRGARIFRIYKFRTMRDAVDALGEPLPDEQRLTRTGRFLRATSLDELPEFWNVLRGDMSLVGPRPLLVEYLPLYNAEQARRHEVRPGLTGWAQVNGRNQQTWDERLALDVWYVDHWTLALDLQILGRTLRQVVRREGISQDGHATMPRFEGTISAGADVACESEQVG